MYIFYVILRLLFLKLCTAAYGIVLVSNEKWAKNGGCAMAQSFSSSFGSQMVTLLSDASSISRCNAGTVLQPSVDNLNEIVNRIPDGADVYFHIILPSGDMLAYIPQSDELLHALDIKELFEPKKFRLTVFADIRDAGTLFSQLDPKSTVVVHPDAPYVTGCPSTLCSSCECNQSVYTAAVAGSNFDHTTSFSALKGKILHGMTLTVPVSKDCPTLEVPKFAISISGGNRWNSIKIGSYNNIGNLPPVSSCSATVQSSVSREQETFFQYVNDLESKYNIIVSPTSFHESAASKQDAYSQMMHLAQQGAGMIGILCNTDEEEVNDSCLKALMPQRPISSEDNIKCHRNFANLIKGAQGSDLLSMCSAWNRDTMEYSRILFVLCAGDSRVSRNQMGTLIGDSFGCVTNDGVDNSETAQICAYIGLAMSGTLLIFGYIFDPKVPQKKKSPIPKANQVSVEE